MFHTLGRLKNRALTGSEDNTAREDVETRIVASANRVIASSEHERQSLIDLYAGRRDRIAVIPCGVDLQRFQPIDRAEAQARLGLSGDVALFVGRMDPIKGLDVLLHAINLLKSHEDLTLVVVGGSGREDEMQRNQALVRSLGIDRQVQFRGAVPQAELRYYYSAATVLVVPSHYESFGLAAVEALACGTPVIGSLVGGLPTVIHDGENGFLVPWRQPAEFAARIERLIGNSPERQELASRARTSVLKFGWDAVADRVLRVYEEVRDLREPTLAGMRVT
jgi:D-inositol-3-phosphate glycosyltransferase